MKEMKVGDKVRIYDYFVEPIAERDRRRAGTVLPLQLQEPRCVPIPFHTRGSVPEAYPRHCCLRGGAFTRKPPDPVLKPTRSRRRHILTVSAMPNRVLS